jgi:hypothetical protein
LFFIFLGFGWDRKSSKCDLNVDDRNKYARDGKGVFFEFNGYKDLIGENNNHPNGKNYFNFDLMEVFTNSDTLNDFHILLNKMILL